jgi:hypothetical protein
VTRGLRAAGALALAAGLWLAVARWGVGLGLLSTVIVTGSVGMVLVVLMSWRPPWAFRLALIWPIAALAALAW